MIIGAHSILYSTDPDADRAFLRDVLKLPNVDVGGGRLIFGLPPAEVAVHPSNENNVHEFYLMCDDVEALIAEMKKCKVACGPVQNQGWGLLTQVTLPGGGKLGIDQPRHARPKPMSARAAEKPAKRAPKSGRPRGLSRSRARGRGAPGRGAP
ncbi:MAG: VOC family protein [Thermoanaerobaculia bacterium]